MIQPTAPTATPADAAASGRTTDLSSKNTFLTLLVAQMENQDPLDPRNASQMSSDLAQFTQVEEQQSTNKYLKLLSEQGSQSASLNQAQASNYLGKNATVSFDNIDYTGGTESFDMFIGGDAVYSTVSIVDDTGTEVNQLIMGAGTGTMPVTWNGTNKDGTPVAPGQYSIITNAYDAQGNKLSSGSQKTGLVEAVSMTDTGAELIIGGVKTPMSQVLEVRI